MAARTPVVLHGRPSAADDPTPTQWRPWRWPLPQSLFLRIPLGAPIVHVGYLAQDRIDSRLGQVPPVTTVRFG
jgi:hypothetical protein